MAAVKGKVAAKVRKGSNKPKKAGSENKGGDGGIFTSKVTAIVRRKRRK